MESREATPKLPVLEALKKERPPFRIVGTRGVFFPNSSTLRPDAPTARQELRGQDVSQMATIESSRMHFGLQRNGRAQVLAAQEGGDRLMLHVAVEANAWPLLSQERIPGWRAWADGTRILVATADGALLAAHLPAGTRIVHLRFLPGSVLAGAMISAVCIVAWRRRLRSPATREPAGSEER